MWDALTVEDRLDIFKYNYPFDYMLTPAMFKKNAEKSWKDISQVMQDKLTWMIKEWQSKQNALTK